MILCNCNKEHELREKLVNKCNSCHKAIKIEWDEQYNNIPIGKEFASPKEREGK